MSERRRQEKARVIPTGWDDDAPAVGARELGTPATGAPATGAPAAGAPAADYGEPGTHPAPAEHVDAAGGPSRRPQRTRSRRTLAIAGVLALIIGTVLVLPSLISVDSPEKAAREYLDALVDGDADVLTAQSKGLDGATGAALAGPIYQAAQQRVSSYRIDAVDASDTTATVQVTLDDGTEQHQSELTLTAHSSGPFAPVDWRLDPVEPTWTLLTYPLGISEIQVNDVTLPIAELTPQVDDMGQTMVVLRLLPGTYEISVPDAGEYLDPIAATVTAPAQLTAGRPVRTETRYDLSGQGNQYVIEEITRQLEECLSTHADPIGGCNLQYPVVRMPLDEDMQVLENDEDAEAPDDEEIPFGTDGPGEEQLPSGSPGEVHLATLPAFEVIPSVYGTYELYGFGGELEATSDPGPAGEGSEVTTVPFDMVAVVVPFTPEEPLQVMISDPAKGLIFETCIEAATGRAYASVREPDTTAGC